MEGLWIVLATLVTVFDAMEVEVLHPVSCKLVNCSRGHRAQSKA